MISQSRIIVCEITILFTNCLNAFLQFNVKTTKILHLTDIHLDLDYLPSGNSDCAHELCCRIGDGPAPSPELEAGFYGDYNGCDLPIHSLENALQQMSRTHPVSVITKEYTYNLQLGLTSFNPYSCTF